MSQEQKYYKYAYISNIYMTEEIIFIGISLKKYSYN